MKHAIVAAHPNAESFTISVARAYREAVAALGQTSVERDLYRMNFDPRLSAGEIPGAKGFAPRPDVEAERALLRDADVFAFVYPLWLNAPPAILKGYLERVFGYGFAYGRGGGGNAPLLAPRKMISFTSSGAPQEWIAQKGAWEAIRTLFDHHFADVCGLEVVDHIHFGRIAPGIREDVVARHLRVVRAAVSVHFAGVAKSALAPSRA
jgi:NAD(P)H dehydrogenase (quinone)